MSDSAARIAKAVKSLNDEVESMRLIAIESIRRINDLIDSDLAKGGVVTQTKDSIIGIEHGSKEAPFGFSGLLTHEGEEYQVNLTFAIETNRLSLKKSLVLKSSSLKRLSTDCEGR